MMTSARDVVAADASSADARATRRGTRAREDVTTARGIAAGARASVVDDGSARRDETVIGRAAKGRARAPTLASGMPVKRRRGRPPTRGGRGFYSPPVAPSADAATATATALHAAYLEMMMHRMMMYHARLAYDTMRRVAAEAQQRALVARESAHKEPPIDADASQKQWPIVPQVSTAICPPRRDSSRSAPGAFGKREAVNAGVQQANAAKSKVNQRKVEGTTSANEASRSSHDDPKAATAKRMQEAKALLDPSTALDRNALAHGANRRGRRSGAPSPESSMEPPSDGADGLAGSVAHGSKGSEKESKSAALS